MSDITITEEMAGELEQALNLAIGMASVCNKESVTMLLDLACRLTDIINGDDEAGDA